MTDHRLTVGQDGFFTNPFEISNIQDRYLPIIDEVIKNYRDIFQPNLLSIYLRGSVASGSAIEYVSDLDMIAIGNKNFDKSYKKLLEQKNARLFQEFPFITKFDCSYITLFDLLNRGYRDRYQFIIKHLSICIYGEDISTQLKKFAPTKEIIFNLPRLERRIENTKTELDEELSSDQIKQICVIIMKLLVRCGFELCVERESFFTRELSTIFSIFSKYYPSKKDEMNEALALVLNPTDNKAIIHRILDQLGMWLVLNYKLGQL